MASCGRVSSTIVFLFLGGLQSVSAGPIYSVQVLGALTGTSSVGSINGSGNGVGYITNAAGDQVPVLLNGQTTALPGIGQANGINSTGMIVGTTYSNGSPMVTEWSGGNQISPGIAGYGTAINDSGQIAGGYITPGGQLNAFEYNGGTLINLGTLGGGWSSAYGINASGQIVGYSMTGAGVFAAFLSNGNSMTNLCPGCSSSSYAFGVNSNGTAVGSFVNSSGYLHASEYSDGNAIDLGTLGGFGSAAYGINDSGSVVGVSYLGDNSTQDAFLYSNNIMVDLNSLLPIASGWTISAAYGINNSGDIIGVGSLNGQTYAVALDPTLSGSANVVAANDPLPVPEPAPMFLTAGALLLFGVRFWHRRRSQITS
jgi:probable HAF family extracellular repeat protein